MFIIHAGEEGKPSWSFAFRVGWRSASSSSIQGRRVFASLAEEANSGYAGLTVCGDVSYRVSGSPAWVALVPPPALPSAAWAERGCPSTARATSRRARVSHIHGFSRATGRTGRSYKMSYAAGAATAFLEGLVLTPAVRTGARTSSCVLG
jgi:hypothetical protein